MAIDPIIKDHQLWIGFVQPEGLVVSPHALKNAQAVLSRSVGAQQGDFPPSRPARLCQQSAPERFPSLHPGFLGLARIGPYCSTRRTLRPPPRVRRALRPTQVVKRRPRPTRTPDPGGGTSPSEPTSTSPAPHLEERRWHASPQAHFAAPSRNGAFPLVCSSPRNESALFTRRKASPPATSPSPFLR